MYVCMYVCMYVYNKHVSVCRNGWIGVYVCVQLTGLSLSLFVCLFVCLFVRVCICNRPGNQI